MIYRLFPVEGFNQPFTVGHNLGEWIELKLNGKIPYGHWVSINFLSTTPHTIWGLLAGQLLISESNHQIVLKKLITSGVILLILGYALDPITPIIKRIATASFVLASGGWTLLALAFSHWLIDIRKKDRMVLFFSVVGMNPLFIYLFAHVGGARLIEKILHPFTHLISNDLEAIARLVTSIGVWVLLWYLCYWRTLRRF